MPFGNYSSFDECIKDHMDKENPEAYCSAIEQSINKAKKEKELNDIEEKGQITEDYSELF